MKRIHFYLPEPMLKTLTALSKTAGTPLSELVRRAIEDYLSRKK